MGSGTHGSESETRTYYCMDTVTVERSSLSTVLQDRVKIVIMIIRQCGNNIITFVRHQFTVFCQFLVVLGLWYVVLSAQSIKDTGRMQKLVH